MTRFAWAAWGLLVVVLDLPLLGWDVLPDVVGYAWMVIGLAGAAEAHEAFVRARAAAAAGIPVALVSGTPLFNDQYGVEWGAAFAGILVFVTVVHQLATGIRDRAPEGDSDIRIYTRGIGSPHRWRASSSSSAWWGSAPPWRRSTSSVCSLWSSWASSPWCSSTGSTEPGGSAPPPRQHRPPARGQPDRLTRREPSP